VLCVVFVCCLSVCLCVCGCVVCVFVCVCVMLYEARSIILSVVFYKRVTLSLTLSEEP